MAQLATAEQTRVLAGPATSRRKWMPIQHSVPAAKPASSDPFVIATSPEGIKPDGKARQRIRSHVMKGKNKRQASPPPVPIGSWVNGEHDPEYHAHPDGARSLVRLGDPRPLIYSDIQTMPGAVDLEPYMLELIVNFEAATRTPTSNVARCMEIDSPFNQLLRDMAYLHAFLFIAQSYFDLLANQDPGHRAILHMTKAINVIRADLAKTEATASLTTLFGVLSLGVVAEARGDLEGARKHRDGLYHLVGSYGGISTLKDMRQLQLKCCRLDIALALKAGSKPLFFTNPSWKTYLSTMTRRPTMKSLPELGRIPDARLVNVWADLREFTISTNLAVEAGRKLEANLVIESLISVLYRLQHLHYDERDEHETLRLSMLAFTTTIFFEDHGVETEYTFLAASLRKVLRSRDYSASAQDSHDSQRYNLWLLFVARISVLDGPEDHGWLVESQAAVRQALGFDRWYKVKEVLKTYLWVDMAHDEAGREFFHAERDPVGTGTL